jgi:hypothetical protein
MLDIVYERDFHTYRDNRCRIIGTLVRCPDLKRGESMGKVLV